MSAANAGSLGRAPLVELRALTGARGIAAWLVVLYHIRLSVAGLAPGWVAVFAKGYLAVDFFFLLSGFVIWLAWHERMRADGWRAAPAFLVRRIARIWPLHLLMLAGAGALALALAATGRADPAHFPPEQLPLHLLLLQNWGWTDYLAWNDPAWSISCEWAAYLLFVPAVLAVDWRRVATPWLLGVLVALFALLGRAMAGEPTLGWDIARFGLARCLVEFAAGTVVCALWLRWRAVRGRAAVAAGVVAVALLAAWLAGAAETAVVPGALAAVLLLLALTDGARHPLAIAPVHFLGEISFATYLSHFLLFVVFKLAVVDDPRAVPPVLVCLYLLLVLGSSIALYHLFERPAQRWVQRQADRLLRGGDDRVRRRRAAPPAHPRSPG